MVSGAVSGAATGAVTHVVSTGSFDGIGEAVLTGMSDGALSGAITGAIAGGVNSNVCFIAGTAVLSSNGYIAIESVRIGNLVWSENPETGEKSLKKVVRTFANETKELVHIFANGEEIITTPEHPFYVINRGWIGAIHLRAGDILVRLNGENVILEKIQHELLEAPVKVYNFEVEEFHTYYVGDSALLVHNSCGQTQSRGVGNKGWVGDKTWKENVATVKNGGTITSLNGGIPTEGQAIRLINESGGKILRIEGAHHFPNPHRYPHINYLTAQKIKGAIRILEI